MDQPDTRAIEPPLLFDAFHERRTWRQRWRRPPRAVLAWVRRLPGARR